MDRATLEIQLVDKSPPTSGSAAPAFRSSPTMQPASPFGAPSMTAQTSGDPWAKLAATPPPVPAATAPAPSVGSPFPPLPAAVPPPVPMAQLVAPPRVLPASDPYIEARKQINAQKEREAVAAAKADLLGQVPKSQAGQQPEQADMLGMLSGGLGKGLQGMGLPPGMAAAAGPVGVALAAAEGVKAKISEMIAKPAEWAEKASGAAQGLAANRADGLLQPLEELPGAMGDVAKSANRVQKAFDDASQAFIDRARQISGFSGQLASSVAMADVARIRRDMAEARDLGPAMSRLVSARSDMQTSLNEALAPLKKVVIDVLANAAQNLTGFIEFIKPFIQANAEVLSFIMRLIGDIKAVIADILDVMAKAPWLSDLKEIAKALRPGVNARRTQSVDPALIRSNDRMIDMLDEIRRDMKAPLNFGVPRFF